MAPHGSLRALPQLVLGLIVIVVGLLFLAHNLGYADAEHYLRMLFRLWAFWPIVFVVAGGAIVWQGLRARQRVATLDDQTTVSGMAVVGGVKTSSQSQSFKGGELTAIMGGCEVDLRQAAINGEAVIDVFAMWGGIEIKVPEQWNVSVRVTPLLGGVENKTRPLSGATAHTLVLRGMVVMGGVEVRN
jgi:predicted membrane protein